MGDREEDSCRDHSPYFLNQYHAYCLKCGFPGLYRMFENQPVDPAEVNGEIDRIEASYPNIRETFRNLGMFDRSPSPYRGQSG